jgi:hypothetical protein
MEQLVDRDVGLDRAENHARRRHDLVHAEVLEEALVLGVVDPGDRSRHVEVVLRHLADDEVVLVIARNRGDDVGPVGAGLGEVLALAAVMRDDDRTDLLGDLRGANPIALHQRDLVAGRYELAGQKVPDLAAANDDNEHVDLLPALSRASAESRSAGPGLHRARWW